MGRWDVSCMRVKVRACMYMNAPQRESLDGCADNKQENEIPKLVRVKRDYALGQIGDPRVS